MSASCSVSKHLGLTEVQGQRLMHQHRWDANAHEHQDSVAACMRMFVLRMHWRLYAMEPTAALPSLPAGCTCNIEQALYLRSPSGDSPADGQVIGSILF